MTGKWIATRLPAKPRTRAVIGALALVGAALAALGTAAPAYTATHLSSSPSTGGGGGSGDNHSLSGTASASAYLSSAPDCGGGGGSGEL
jgi:hypothetical protein